MNRLKENLKKEYHKAYRGILTDEFIDRSWEWTYGFFEPYMNSETPCDTRIIDTYKRWRRSHNTCWEVQNFLCDLLGDAETVKLEEEILKGKHE